MHNEARPFGDAADCCPEGEFCCGDACLVDGTQTFAPCGVSTCCDRTPPVKVDECCTEENPVCLCAGLSGSPGFCSTEDTFVLCPEVLGGTCCDEPTPIPGQDCCPAGQSCCGDGCIPNDRLPLALCPVPGLCGCEDETPICKQESGVMGPCEAAIAAWTFDAEAGTCIAFTYGGCSGNENNFETQEACMAACPTESEEPCICTQEFAPVCNPETRVTYGNRCEAACAGEDPDGLVEGACEDLPIEVCEQESGVVGTCRASIPRWTFEAKSGTCIEFIYGGCFGNENNFETEQACMAACPTEDEEPCICTLEFAPLCNPVTGVTYGNRCDAVTCNGEDPADLVDGECDGEEPCICTLEFMPLCNPETGVTYGNRCEAVTCAGEDPADLVAGACEDPPPVVAECCTEELPFCLCSGGPNSPGFCATAETAARTTCLAVEGGTCCDAAEPTPILPPPCGLLCSWLRGFGGCVQQQRLRLKAIKQLGMTAAQHTQQAADWHRWVRRREALTTSLVSASASLSSILPSDLDISTLLAALPEVCTVEYSDADSLQSQSTHSDAYEGVTTQFFVQLLNIVYVDDATKKVPNENIAPAPQSSEAASVKPPHADIPQPAQTHTQITSPECIRAPPSQMSSRPDLSLPAERPEKDNSNAHDAPDTEKQHWKGSLSDLHVPNMQQMSTEPQSRKSNQISAMHAAHACEEELPFAAAPLHRKELLGESGDSFRALEVALKAVQAVMRDDALLIADSSLPLYNLTPVQNAILLAAPVTCGCAKCDFVSIMQMSAHHERWKMLFAPWKHPVNSDISHLL